MKSVLYILLLINIYSCPFYMMGQDKTFKVEKTFDIASDAKVTLISQYGEVFVGTWDEDRVSIKIDIEAEGKDADALQEISDQMGISVTGNSQAVVVKTSLTSIAKWNRSHRQVSIEFKNGKRYELNSLSIYYTIQMPKSNILDLKHKYGDVRLDDLDKGANIQVAYGDIAIDKIKGKSHLSIQYGDMEADYFERGEINVAYGELEVNYAPFLVLEGDYSDVKIGKVDSLITEGSYVDFEIGEINYLRSEENHSSFQIWDLLDVGLIEVDYGEVEIGTLGQDFSQIDIKGAYTDVEISIVKGSRYHIDLKTAFGDIDYPSDIQISEKISKENHEKIVGKTHPTASAKILVETAFGDIKVQ